MSERQVKRLVRAYRTQGAAAVRSKKRGRLSNWCYADILRERVLALEAGRYNGFRPALLAGYLHAIRMRRPAGLGIV